MKASLGGKNQIQGQRAQSPVLMQKTCVKLALKVRSGETDFTGPGSAAKSQI